MNNQRTDSRGGVWMAALLALAGILAGCGSSGASGDGVSGAALGSASGQRGDLEDPFWGIGLTHHSGSDAAQQARRSMAALEQLLGRRDLRVRTSGERALVLLGRYESARDPSAHEDLEFVRSLAANGRRLFPAAHLHPPLVDARGSLPQYSLDFAADEHPGVRYTLQIAAYEHRGGRAAARRAAEEAVRSLRAEGEQAFYHHATWVSTVHVGLFDDSDLDPRSNRPIDPELLALMERYPHNLVNGYTVTQRVGNQETVQASQLVELPGTAR